MTNDIRGTQPYDMVHLGEFPLTKREAFVLAVATGMLANPEVLHGQAYLRPADVVEYADALILALNKDSQ